MSFLEPWFLLGLLAAGLPIAIHLFNRKKATKRPFPAIALLLASKDSSAKSIKVRQRLLLLLRVLMLLLLALALAKPFCLSERGLTASERLPTAVVVVLDSSASMGYGAWWARAKEIADDSLDQLRPWDEVALISTTNPDSTPLSTDHTRATSKLQALRPAPVSGSLSRSLARGIELLGASQLPNKRLVLIGDFAASSLPTDPPPLAQNLEYQLHTVRTTPAEQTPENLGIQGVEYVQSGDVQNQWIMTATLKNYGPKVLKDTQVDLELDGTLLSSQRIEQLGPGAEVPVRFALEGDPSRTEPQSGRVSLAKGDAFPQDDQWHFVFRTRTRVEVLIVNGEPSAFKDEDEAFFLGAALNPTGDTRRGILTTLITPDAMAEQNFESFDVVILANVPRVIAPVASKLEAFVTQGGGLLITGGDQLDVDALNQTLRPLLPRPLRGLKELTDRQDPDAPVKLTRFGTPAHMHPIFRAFTASGGETLQSTQIYSYMLLEPGANPATKTLLTLQDDAPLLLERAVGRGRVLFFGTSVDFEWTDLPVRSAYLPLMQRMVRHLARRSSSGAEHPPTVGQPMDLDVTHMAKERVILSDPKGGRIVLELPELPQDQAPGDQRLLPFTPPLQGPYKVWADEVTQEATDRLAMLDFAANLSRDESDLKGLPQDAWRRWLDSNPDQDAPLSDPSSHTPQANKRVNLWPKILFLITLILLAETLLGTRRSLWRRGFPKA